MKKTKGIKKFIVVGVLLLTCLLIVSGLLFVRNHKNSKAYEQAMSFFEQNKYEEAAEVFSSIGHYKDAQKLEDRCRLELGNYYLKNNEYDKAENEFKQINDISLSEQEVKKCRYINAQRMFDNNEFVSAKTIFEQLGDYEASSKYVTQCKVALKYSKFDYTGEDVAYSDYYGLNDPTPKASLEVAQINDYHAAELCFSSIYGVWYDGNDQTIKVDEISFDGKEYGVCAIKENTSLIYFYESPDDLYEVYYYQDYVAGTILNIMPYGDYENCLSYNSLSSAEYEEACRLWEEEQAKKQNYEDNIVIDKTVAKARDILSDGYSGTERLYHATTVNSSSVNYDWSTRTYTCYVNITYSTNAFDFWGTSSNTYDITATYVDGGGELIATGFDMF